MNKSIEQVGLELNGYRDEINAVIQGEIDEKTGFYPRNALLGEFVSGQHQAPVFHSFINITNSVDVVHMEPCSKKLVIERAINAVQQMQDLLEESMEQLVEMLKDER